MIVLDCLIFKCVVKSIEGENESYNNFLLHSIIIYSITIYCKFTSKSKNSLIFSLDDFASIGMYLVISH